MEPKLITVILIILQGKSIKRLGPEVIKVFSSSAQLSMKFQLLINAEIVEINGKFRFKPQTLVIYPVGILTFMSRINFKLS